MDWVELERDMAKDVPNFVWFLERLREIRPGMLLEEKLVREAAEIIWKKIPSSPDVNAIVSELPATRRTLERRFREQTGLTISEVIAVARLEKAKWLLTETSLPIHAVAIQAGYASSDWMGKVMRQAVGNTPSGFRLEACNSKRGN